MDKVRHNASNDSIMNPLIRGANQGHQISTGQIVIQEGKTEPDENIQIVENFSVQESNQNAGSEQNSSRRQQPNATISLQQLQEKYVNNKSRPHHSPNNNNDLPLSSQQSHIESGRFGAQRASDINSMPQVINFDQLDEEEKMLEEQFQQLSQNQRDGTRGVFSNQGTGRRINMAVSNETSNRVPQDIRSTTFSNEQLMSIRNEEEDRSNNSLAFTNGQQESEYRDRDMNVQDTYSSRRESANRQIRDSQSQQSLLNRNTSPWINHNNVSQSDREGAGESSGSMGRVRGRSLSNAENLPITSDSNRPRDMSIGSNDSVTGNLPFTEHNFRLMQVKINQQAERLMGLQQIQISPVPQVPRREETSHIKVLEEKIRLREEVIVELQNKVRDVSNGLHDQVKIQDQLQVTEEYLRRETMINEEQRATIAILKNGIEANLQKLGLRFTNKNGKQIDGYLQLVRFQNNNEQLEKDSQTLRDQLAKFEENHQLSLQSARRQTNEQLDTLKGMHKKQLADKDAHLNCILEDKDYFRKEKENLLQYNQDLKKMSTEAEKAQHDFKVKCEILTDQKQQLQNKNDDLVQQKKNQDELITEVKHNIAEMRLQKETLNSEVGQLKNRNERLEQDLKQLKDRKKANESEIMNLNLSLLDRNRVQKEIENDLSLTMSNKEQEITGIRQRLQQWQEQLNDKDSELTKQRIKIQDLLSKIDYLEISNSALKKTLQETQSELVNLVDQHEQLTQKQSIKSQDVLLLAAEISKHKTEVQENKNLIMEYQTRLERKDEEMKGLQKLLNRQNENDIQGERKVLQDYQHKDGMVTSLSTKIKELEEDIRDKNMKIDFLEKVKEEFKVSEKQLRRSIEMKQLTFDDLNRELRTVRSEYEKQSTILENTMNERTQDHSKLEMKLTLQVDQMVQELDTLRQQKVYAERLMGERMESLKKHEEQSKGVTPEQLEKLQKEIKSNKDKADEIVASNEKLKSQNKKIRDSFDGIAKKILKMNSKMTKFQKQVQKVLGLDHKYTYLFQVSQDHQPSDEGHKYDGPELLKMLDGLMVCNNLVKSQMKQQIIQNEQISTDTSQFDVKLDLIQNDKIPRREQSARIKQHTQHEDVAEQYLKAKIEETEARLQIEKEMRQDYENFMNKLVNLQSIRPNVSQLISLISNCLKKTLQYKNETRLIGAKLSQEEQKYEKILKSEENGIHAKHQLISLKQNIEKDRVQLKHLDLSIDTAERELHGHITELQRMDSSEIHGDKNQKELTHQLEDKLSHMRIQYEEVNSRKLWLEARLHELEFQQNQVQPMPLSGRSSRRLFNRPHSSQGRYDEQKSQSPVYSLRQSRNQEERNLPPMMNKKFFERSQSAQRSIQHSVPRDFNRQSADRRVPEIIDMQTDRQADRKEPRLRFNFKNCALNIEEQRPRDASNTQDRIPLGIPNAGLTSSTNLQSNYAKNMYRQLDYEGTQKFGNLVNAEDLRDSLQQIDDGLNDRTKPIHPYQEIREGSHHRLQSEVSVQNIFAHHHQNPSFGQQLQKEIYPQQSTATNIMVLDQRSAEKLTMSNKYKRENLSPIREGMPNEIHSAYRSPGNFVPESSKDASPFPFEQVQHIDDYQMDQIQENAMAIAQASMSSQEPSDRENRFINLRDDQRIIDTKKSNPLRSSDSRSSGGRGSSNKKRDTSPLSNKKLITSVSPGVKERQHQRNMAMMTKGNYLLPLQLPQTPGLSSDQFMSMYGTGSNPRDGQHNSQTTYVRSSVPMSYAVSNSQSNDPNQRVSYVVTNSHYGPETNPSKEFNSQENE